MARMTCKCGEVLSNVETPNNIEYVVYSDIEWSKIIDTDMLEPWKIPQPKYDVWRCPKCERIYVFKDNMDKAHKIYKLEE